MPEEVNHSSLGLPERHSVARTAPELDQTASSLQVAVETGLHLAHDTGLPEVAERPGKSNTKYSASWYTTNSNPVQRRLCVVFLGAATIVIAIGLGLGLELGFGLRAKITIPSQSSNLTSMISAASTSTTQSSTQPSGLSQSQYRILDDTSIATVIASSGDRHVFFQDQSGLIRESIYSVRTQNWSSPISYTVATDAKNFTPISAFQVPVYLSASGNEEVHVIYINTVHALRYQIYNIDLAFWSNTSNYYYYGIWNMTTDPDTRALSMTLRRNETLLARENATLTQALNQPNALDADLIKFIAFQCYLLYENTSGQLTLLLGSFNYSYPTTSGFYGPNITVGASWIWQNLELAPQLMPYTTSVWGSGPFSSSITPPLEASSKFFDLAISLLLFPDTSVTTFPTVYGEYVFNDSIVLPGETGEFENTTDPRSIDFTQGCVTNGSTAGSLFYSFWVNGTTIVPLIRGTYGQILPPTSSFPFTRLGSVSQANSSTINLYHQIDQETLSEHIYDTTVGHWTTSNISILTN